METGKRAGDEAEWGISLWWGGNDPIAGMEVVLSLQEDKICAGVAGETSAQGKRVAHL